MEWLRAFLEQQQLLSLFLVIGLGYAIGEISIRGFSLGVGAVLFVGLAVGAMAPKAQPPGLVGLIGLVLFLYGVGTHYGKQFFAGLTGAAGRRYNLLALLALAVTAGVTVFSMGLFHIPATYTAGLFSGAGTSTAALQAAIEAAKNTDPAVGYSVAYPFGVIVPILCMYFMQAWLKPKVEAPSGTGLELMEVAIRQSDIVGTTLGELIPRLPTGVMVTAVRTGQVNRIPAPDVVLGENDVLLLTSKDKAALEEARTMLGEHAPGVLVEDRSNIDYVRVFASKRNVVGLRLSDLTLPDGMDATIVQVRRGDSDLLATSDLILEFGDRVGLFANRKHFPGIRKFFGDSIKGTTEFSYISTGIGMVLGVILGVLPVPIPGLGTISLGLAGGPLIIALILGKLGRTGGLTWTMPLSANLTLRNFGLTVFLAQVGMSSGPKFVATVQQTGVTMLFIGMLIVLVLVLATMLIGHYLMRIPFDDLLGITAGVTGNPAILAHAARSVPTDRPDIGYAMIFPGATIVKIIIVQLLVTLAAR